MSLLKFITTIAVVATFMSNSGNSVQAQDNYEELWREVATLEERGLPPKCSR